MHMTKKQAQSRPAGEQRAKRTFQAKVRGIRNTGWGWERRPALSNRSYGGLAGLREQVRAERPLWREHEGQADESEEGSRRMGQLEPRCCTGSRADKFRTGGVG